MTRARGLQTLGCVHVATTEGGKMKKEIIQHLKKYGEVDMGNEIKIVKTDRGNFRLVSPSGYVELPGMGGRRTVECALENLCRV